MKTRRWTMGLLAGAGLFGLMLWAGAGRAQLFVTADRVTNGGIVDAVDFGNSTRTNLNSIDSFVSGDLASFTGRPFDTLGFAFTNVFVLASQQSSTNGLRFLWAADLASANFSILASTSILESGRGYSFSFTPRARYFRVQYVNGLTKLTSFTLAVIHKGGGANDLVSIGGFSPVSFAAGVLVSTMPFSPSTPVLTSQTGLGSVSTGFGNVVLSSAVDSGGFRPPALTSMFRKVWGTLLDSVTLIAGTSGMRIAAYSWDIGLESLVSSVGFYSTNPGSTKLFGALPLWSSEYAAQGGISKTGLCGPARCWPLFLTSVGDDLSFATTSTGNEGRVRVNLLWSYER